MRFTSEKPLYVTTIGPSKYCSSLGYYLQTPFLVEIKSGSRLQISSTLALFNKKFDNCTSTGFNELKFTKEGKEKQASSYSHKDLPSISFRLI